MKPRLFAILVVFGVAGASLAQPISIEQKDKVLAGIQEVIEKRAFVPNVDFAKWGEFIGKRKDEIGKAEQINDFTRQVNGALREFGFSHIRLQSPRQASMRNRTSMVGLGVSTSPSPDGLRVTSVREASPATEAGLAVGDVIEKVNGEAAKEMTQLEGNEGDKRTLAIKNANGDRRDVEVTFKTFSLVRKETLTPVGKETQMLKVFTFSAGYGRQLIEEHVKAVANSKNLILDLRSNGGGAVNNLNHLLSLLMPDGTPYGTFITRSVFDRFVKANPDTKATPEAIAEWAKTPLKTRARTVTPYRGKIIVLINRGSGSASEIAALSLKEQTGAILIGNRSAGAVLASTFARLPEGFALQFPMSDYVTAKGVRIEGNPIQPDHVIADPVTKEKDPAVDKALELLGDTPPNPLLVAAAI